MVVYVLKLYNYDTCSTLVSAVYALSKTAYAERDRVQAEAEGYGNNVRYYVDELTLKDYGGYKSKCIIH